MLGYIYKHLYHNIFTNMKLNLFFIDEIRKKHCFIPHLISSIDILGNGYFFCV